MANLSLKRQLSSHAAPSSMRRVTGWLSYLLAGSGAAWLVVATTTAKTLCLPGLSHLISSCDPSDAWTPAPEAMPAPPKKPHAELWPVAAIDTAASAAPKIQ